MERKLKILVIKFKYLGDVVLATPALRALREKWPGADLHVLVAQEAAPLLEHIPWISKVWAYPRRRGRAQIREVWPLLRRLRAERFDRTVDLAGNDRGALTSLLCAAPRRLGVIAPLGFFGRRFCYNETIPEAHLDQHESKRDAHVLGAWGVGPPSRWDLEVHPDPQAVEAVRGLLPPSGIICHITTSQTKKEWPIQHWFALRELAAQRNHSLYFTAGPSPREQALLEDLRKLGVLARQCGPAGLSLPQLIALFSLARLVVSVDTAPLHVAAGLGLATISLFGSSRALQFAPLGPIHRVLTAKSCQCSVDARVCSAPVPCLTTLRPGEVWSAIEAQLALPAAHV